MKHFSTVIKYNKTVKLNRDGILSIMAKLTPTFKMILSPMFTKPIDNICEMRNSGNGQFDGKTPSASVLEDTDVIEETPDYEEKVKRPDYNLVSANNQK